MPRSMTLAVLLAATSQPVSIYVGPNVRNGFVDIDKGVQDSIEDLRQELRRNSSLRLVADEAAARLKLYVAGRSKANTGDSVVTGQGSATAGGAASGVGVAVAIEGYRVETILRVGDYERQFTGESKSRWKGCARSIAEDLAIWLKANQDHIPDGK
jgi:hypothetical protein